MVRTSPPRFSRLHFVAMMSFLLVSLFLAVVSSWFSHPAKQPRGKRGKKGTSLNTCHHWIQIQGEVRKPNHQCLQKRRISFSQQVTRAILLAEPTCVYVPSSLSRMPKHGEVVVLQKSRNKHCSITFRPMSGKQKVLFGIRISLNHDDVETLAAIPHLRRKIAKRIVSYRQKHGSFRSLADVQNVRGIGRKTIAKIKRYVSLKPK